MKVSVAIMAMSERSSYVDDIVERLDASPVIVWDTKRDRYDTGRRALAAYDRGATHHLVLQDDALPCRDLIGSLERAVERVPHNPISLYYGHGTNGAHQRTNAMAAKAPRPGLLVFEGPWWGVAVCFPTALIDRILQISDRPQSTPAYDKRLSRALQRLRIDTFYVLPSLVDHRLDGPSMVPGRTQDDRHAHHFIGADASALDIDWCSLPVVDGHRSGSVKPRQEGLAPEMMMRPRPWSGTPKVSVSVMAHPRRRVLADALGEQMGAEVVYDRHGDRWETGRRAWLARDPDATHHLVLQDDAIPAPKMLDSLREALTVVGDNPVGLYLGGVRPANQLMGAMVAHARKTGAAWVVGDGPMWGVGVCLPTHMVAPMLEHCDRRTSIAAYDRRMAAYFRQAGIDCWYTMPSLVDHRGEEPSLVQRNRTVRRARFFAHEGAAHIDWTRLPHTTGKPFVTYSGAAGRRFHRCLHCGFYTPMRHSIDRHVRECAPATDRMAHAEL